MGRMLRTFLALLAWALVPATGGWASPIDDDREAVEQNVVIDAVKTAIARRDYTALNAMGTEFRLSRARTSSGIWKLSVFHWRVLTELGPGDDGQCDDRSADFFKGWIAKSPKEPAPYISRAAVLEALAWCIRGDGYADSVSAPALEGFIAKVDEAHRLLDTHRATAMADPHYYAVMARLFIDVGAEKAAFMKLLDEATAREPNYHYLYFDAYRYFQPQWYGSDAEVEQLARYAVARSKSAEGLGVYARYYWFAFDCECEDIVRSIDWPTMKAAMRDVMARYPSDWNAANFARISCVMQDPQEARSWFGRVKGDHTVAWTKMDEALRCQRMAQLERSTERCPQAAREAWTRAEVDKYCRFGS